MLGWCFASAWTALGTQSAPRKHIAESRKFVETCVNFCFCKRIQTLGETLSCLSQTGEGFLLRFDLFRNVKENATGNEWSSARVAQKLPFSYRDECKPQTLVAHSAEAADQAVLRAAQESPPPTRAPVDPKACSAFR